MAKLLKHFYLLCAVLLIALAVLVQAGRSLFPLLEHRQQGLADYLSDQLGVTVAVEDLRARWPGLTPALTLNGLTVEDADGHRLLAAERLDLRLNLLSSLLQGRWAWEEVALHRPRLSLIQGEDGYWGVPDLAAGAGAQADEPLAPDDLLALFQLGARVELLDANIELTFASGHRQAFVAPYLLLEHRDDFHRLSLQLDLPERDRSLWAVVEGRGDPSEPESFDTRGYLRLRDFPTLEPLTALGGILLGETGPRDWYRHGQMSAQLWFDGGPEGYQWSGDFELEDLALSDGPAQLHRVSGLLGGQWQRGGAWQWTLNELSGRYRDAELKPLRARLASDGGKQPVRLQLDRVDLGYWAPLVRELGLLGEGELARAVRALAPEGWVRHIQLSWPRSGQSDWSLEAELDGVAVAPWDGIPGFEGLAGYVSAGPGGGYVDVTVREGLAAHFAPVYAEPIRYQQARGRVAWTLRPERDRLYVHTGPVNLRDGEQTAQGAMWLAIPWTGEGEIDLYFDVQGQQMRAEGYRQYLPEVVPEALESWLVRSVGENNPGLAERARFIFRGTVNRSEQPRNMSYQLALDMAGAEFDYHPDWPALSDLSGHLWLDNERVEARVDSARVYSDSTVTQAQVVVDDNPVDEGLSLSVDAELDADIEDGLKVLREGYLRRVVGDRIDQWQARGRIDAGLDLTIPLEEGAAGARQRVSMNMDVPRLHFGELGLTLTDLRGPLSYDSDSGISGEGLTARLFDHPLQLSLSSARQDDLPVTRVDLAGRASGEALEEWTGRPTWRLLEGEFDFDSRLTLFHHPEPDAGRDQRLATLELESDLAPVRLDLPEPFGKVPGESRPTSLGLVLGRQTVLSVLEYDGRLEAAAQFDRERVRLQRLALGLNRAAELPGEPGIAVQGSLERLQVPQWREFVDRYRKLLADSDEDDALAPVFSPLEQLPVSARLRLTDQQLGPLSLAGLELRAQSSGDQWDLSLAHENVSGEVQWRPDRPLQVDLAYLHLPEAALGGTGQAKETSPWSLQWQSLPEADVSVAELTLGEAPYGQWQFDLRPGPEALTLEDIRGSARGLTLAGAEDAEGARLRWEHPGAGGELERTHLTGVATAGNLSDVLSAWGQTDVLESESSRHQLDLAWPGGPTAFDLTRLSGEVGFAVREGRFKRNPAEGSEGLLRLFAVLNFDSLARRLRLDFSDLYQSGLAYDSIDGRVSFERGQMLFVEPVDVESPSSRFQLGGRIDLKAETLDTRLIATLPVAGNLTFLTAVAAGLPAAAGVFLVSKLFEKQVDQATSISYTIQGSWDDPIIEYDRMFEQGTSLTPEAQAEADTDREETP